MASTKPSVTVSSETLASFEEKAPLYCQFAGQLQPQSACIDIDLQTGVVSASYNSNIGGYWYSRREHFGVIQSWAVNPAISGKALSELIDDIKPHLQIMLDNSLVDYFGGVNQIAKLNEKAEQARDEIERVVEQYRHYEYSAQIWDADYLLACCDLLDHWPAGMSLEKAASELEQSAEREDAVLDVDPVEFLLKETLSYFECERLWGRLGWSHIDALIDNELIDNEQAQAWCDDNGK